MAVSRVCGGNIKLQFPLMIGSKQTDAVRKLNLDYVSSIDRI